MNNPASGSVVLSFDRDFSENWSFKVDSPVIKEILVDSEGDSYFVTIEGVAYSLDKNGQKKWSLDLGSHTERYPVLWEDSLFVVVDGKLFKLGEE